MRKASRREERALSRDLSGPGELEALTGLDRLPRAVRLDSEREDIPRAMRAPHSAEAVYPWASPRIRHALRSFPVSVRFSNRQVVPQSKGRGVWWALSATPPAMRRAKSVDFCVRRKARREVLFAVRRAGFRGSAPKRSYRRSGDSQYRC